MRTYLINPTNPLVGIVNAKKTPWTRYRVWKPLGLMVLAGLTPLEWDTTLIDENLSVPDYAAMPKPDLVGITAFTSQAKRAYEVAAGFRARGVPVVMGGIHATMCTDEALRYVDTVVTGEGEDVWPRVLTDFREGTLQRRYDGKLADLTHVPPARHDLLPNHYFCGSIQTTRGCPLSCSFCSVTTFNGAQYRQRPIEDVVREFQRIRERYVLVVDDNLIGTRSDHIARAKELFRALIRANLKKKWIAQVTINFADDEEMLSLAAQAGCQGVFIGFESATPEGLMEVSKKFNLAKDRDFRASVKRIQQHNIQVVGSFILGLDVDTPGIGRRIAETADAYGVDYMNTMFLTPLPGTQLWQQMQAEGRVLLDDFPDDWQFYTLTYPVARYRHLSSDAIIEEMEACNRRFYALPRILSRVIRLLYRRQNPLVIFFSNLSYRTNLKVDRKAFAVFSRGQREKEDA